MASIEPSSDYLERQCAREKATHWENRAHEAEAEVKRLRRLIGEVRPGEPVTTDWIARAKAALDG